MINSLAVAINQLISELNLNVKKYNTTSGENGEEFDEGGVTVYDELRRVA